MTNNFWGPIFSKLQEDCNLLKLMLEDSDNKTLLSLVKEDPALLKACQKFIRNKKILSAQQQNVIEQFMLFLNNKATLRKIVFETWIKNNSSTLVFPTVAINKDSVSALKSGVYGGALKIRILSFIDPRDAAKPIYAEFFKDTQDTQKIQLELENLKKSCQNWEEKFENQKTNFSALKQELKETRNELKTTTNKLKTLEKS